MNYLEEYKKWCESDEFDEETKKELQEPYIIIYTNILK